MPCLPIPDVLAFNTMRTLYRFVSLLLLLWLPITLASAGGLRACPAHQLCNAVSKHHHHAANTDISSVSTGSDCHHAASHNDSNCTHCLLCHIPASLPHTLTLAQPHLVMQITASYFPDHYHSIAIPPADRPPLFC